MFQPAKRYTVEEVNNLLDEVLSIVPDSTFEALVKRDLLLEATSQAEVDSLAEWCHSAIDTYIHNEVDAEYFDLLDQNRYLLEPLDDLPF